MPTESHLDGDGSANASQRGEIKITERKRNAKDPDEYVFREKIDQPKSSRRFKYNVAPKEKSQGILSQRGSKNRGIMRPSDSKAAENAGQKDDTTEEESICSVCFSEPASTVLLDCGHGGICLNCALDSMKKNNLCPFCRQKVVQIIQIQTTEIRKGLYKVVNSFYVSDGGLA
jgi:hypothetical protein